jgi:hypothetical protein
MAKPSLPRQQRFRRVAERIADSEPEQHASHPLGRDGPLMRRRLSVQEGRRLDIQAAFGNQTLEQQAITLHPMLFS